MSETVINKSDSIELNIPIPHLKILILGVLSLILSIEPNIGLMAIKNNAGSVFGWQTVCNEGNATLGCINGVPVIIGIAITLSSAILIGSIVLARIPNHNLGDIFKQYYWWLYLVISVILYLLWFQIVTYKDSLNIPSNLTYHKLGLAPWAIFLSLMIFSYLGIVDREFTKNLNQSQRFAFYGVITTILSLQLNVRNDPGLFDVSWRRANELSMFKFGEMEVPYYGNYPWTLWIAIFMQVLVIITIVFKKFRKYEAVGNIFSLASGILIFSIWLQVTNNIRDTNENINFTEDVHDQGLAMWFLFVSGSFLIISGLIGLKAVQNQYKNKIKPSFYNTFPYGRQSPKWSNIVFIFALIIIGIATYNQPAGDDNALRFVIIQIITLICIFTIAGMSLNIHTGLTGMVNFGVVFFVAIGAITTAMLPGNYGIHPFTAMLIGIALSAVIGFLLAFPTISLRDDYFAIVTISLGEILRFMLIVEPWLRYDPTEQIVSRPGITNYDRPFEDWWANTSYRFPEIGTLFDNTIISYQYVIMAIAIVGLIISYFVAQALFNSPYGRIMKTIREDEDVVESYGHNVFLFKAVVLAVGAGMAAFAGSLFAWVQHSVFPDFLNPVGTTFLFWTVFVIGGKGNNKGMIIGGGFVILTDLTFRTLAASNRVSTADTLLDNLDKVFQLIVIDIGGKLFSESSYRSTFLTDDAATVNVNFLKIVLVGLSIIVIMVWNEDGILPEIPYRPPKPKTITNPLINSSNSNYSLNSESESQSDKKEGTK
ncbi:MAG: branched-chain amino acid ABC transporter permease [Candidatus Kariarchaeaceae archaeon]|jgi:ABC-type branched-subunit amino acid transport system permease subunit